jgi:hypothetical protein
MPDWVTYERLDIGNGKRVNFWIQMNLLGGGARGEIRLVEG